MSENKVKILIEERDDNMFIPYCVWNDIVHILSVLDSQFNFNDKESSLIKFNNKFVAVAIETSRGGKIILATNE